MATTNTTFRLRVCVRILGLRVSVSVLVRKSPWADTPWRNPDRASTLRAITRAYAMATMENEPLPGEPAALKLLRPLTSLDLGGWRA